MRNNLLHCNKLGACVRLYGLHARYEEVYASVRIPQPQFLRRWIESALVYRLGSARNGSAWSVEETRALLNLWGDDRVQRQLEGSWKLFSTVGLCPHTLQVSYDGRAVDRDDIPPPPSRAHSSHHRYSILRSAYAFMHMIMRLFIGDSASSVQKLYTNVTRPFPPRPR